jgi:hypothetical protein
MYSTSYSTQLTTVKDKDDPITLGFYTQHIRLRLSDKEEESERVFQGPGSAQQKAIEGWEKGLGLAYEFERRSVGTRRVAGADATPGRHEIRDGNTQTRHPDTLDKERRLQDEAASEGRTLKDSPVRNAREETASTAPAGEMRGDKITSQRLDATTEAHALQNDAKTSQDSSSKETADTTWSTVYQAKTSGSPVGLSPDIASSDIAPPTKTSMVEHIYSTVVNSPISSNANPTVPTMSVSAPSAPSLTPHPYPEPLPTWNLTDGSYFPGSLLHTPMQPIQTTLDIEEASRLADEKRKRNAGVSASCRCRARRKGKEKQAAARFEALGQNIVELEGRLREMEAEKEFYRFERDRFRDMILRIPRLRHLVLPSAKL